MNTDNAHNTSLRNEIQKEIALIEPRLEAFGFVLESKQPHISGERMIRSLEANLVLIAHHEESDIRAVVKCSRKPAARKEIMHEKKVRDLLDRINYAGSTLLSPRELFYTEQEDFVFLITEYIEQDRIFVSYPLKEQFFMILQILESMETFHITTHEMEKGVKLVCPIVTFANYAEKLSGFKDVVANVEKDSSSLLDTASAMFHNNKHLVDMFSPFLMHDDFVPHNFRIKDRQVYMLDHATVWFGNKYESWARLLNYVQTHNPKLKEKLLQHIKISRQEEDYEAIRIMRIYKIFQILAYYGDLLTKTEGDLKKLTKVRLDYWLTTLDYVTRDELLPIEIRDEFVASRNSLRSDEEKERQREFAEA